MRSDNDLPPPDFTRVPGSNGTGSQVEEESEIHRLKAEVARLNERMITLEQENSTLRQNQFSQLTAESSPATNLENNSHLEAPNLPLAAGPASNDSTPNGVNIEEQRLQQLFENAPAYIAVLRGPNHVFEIVNRRYYQLVQRQTSMVGLPFAEALPELEVQGYVKLLDHVYQTGQPFEGQEAPVELNRFDNSDGDSGNGTGDEGKVKTFMYMNFIYQPIYSPDGATVEGIFIHTVDVTSQVLARQRVEELNRLKDEFIAVASHDLRTPVTSIRGFAQVLGRHFYKQRETLLAAPSDEPMDWDSVVQFFENSSRIITTVLNQTTRLNDLINRLLDISQIEQGQLQLQYQENIDLITLLMEVVAALSLNSEEHLIQMAPPAESAILLSCDPIRLEQVLNNLITNAVKYSPAGTTITVGLELVRPDSAAEAPNKTGLATNSGTVLVWVRDQGYGISQEEQAHLFERFYRVRNTQNANKGGLGLGLYISAAIVNQHGGRLWVESAPGAGSTFFIALPAGQPSQN